MIYQGLVAVIPVTYNHRNKPHCYIEVLNIMLAIRIMACLCIMAIKRAESRSKSLPAEKQHAKLNDYRFSSGFNGAKTKEKGADHKKTSSGPKPPPSGAGKIMGAKSKKNNADCPPKEPEEGGTCKDKSLECSFESKNGTKTFTCPDKKWEYIAVGVPLKRNAKGDIIKENGTDYIVN